MHEKGKYAQVAAAKMLLESLAAEDNADTHTRALRAVLRIFIDTHGSK